MERDEWIRLIGGGFAHQTAPFALHAQDEKRANEYLVEAQAAGLTLSDALDHASAYLDNAKGWQAEKKNELMRVRDFFTDKLPS